MNNTVEGGELQVGGAIDEVVAPQQNVQAQYSVDVSLANFLKNTHAVKDDNSMLLGLVSRIYDKMNGSIQESTVKKKWKKMLHKNCAKQDKLTPTVQAFIDAVGSDHIELELGWDRSTISGAKNPGGWRDDWTFGFYTGRVNFEDVLPAKIFKAFLYNAIGQEQTDTLLQTDIAQTIGLDQRSVSISGGIMKYLPQLQEVQDVKGKYLLPQDLQLLLLSLQPGHRKLLSSYLDRAKKEDVAPFDTFPKKPTYKRSGMIWLEQPISCLYDGKQLLAVAREQGATNIGQYVGELEKLQRGLERKNE